jgi:CBS domain-containing protein
MPDRLMYVSRLVRLPLVGTDGLEFGRLQDLVLGPSAGGEPPRVNGFVVGAKQRVFVNAGRVAELSGEGARLRFGTVHIRRFEPRQGETLVVGELFGRRARGKRVVDVGIRPVRGEMSAWEVATVALGSVGLALPRAPTVVEWSEVTELFAAESPEDRQAAAIGLLHPAEMAEALHKLPIDQRDEVAEALQEERLADLLEELPEQEQMRILRGLDPERAGRVLDEMEADDAADLLGEFSVQQRDALLAVMAPDEAAPVRRLLTYRADTAGGLMNPEPIIMLPTATVAEALARIRDPDLPATLASEVFVTAAPTETPTGRYLGVVGFQRLLREVPSRPLARCLDEQAEPLAPETSDQEVAARLAAYDAVAVAVVDAQGRLVGAISVDDVLDRILPANWRRR